MHGFNFSGFQPPTSDLVRWDRYENKQLYWVEEDMKAEWGKKTSKARHSQAEYESKVSASSVLGDSMDGLEFGPPVEGQGFSKDGIGPVKVLKFPHTLFVNIAT